MSEYVLVFQHGKHVGQLPAPRLFNYKSARFRQLKLFALALLKLLLSR